MAMVLSPAPPFSLPTTMTLACGMLETPRGSANADSHGAKGAPRPGGRQRADRRRLWTEASRCAGFAQLAGEFGGDIAEGFDRKILGRVPGFEIAPTLEGPPGRRRHTDRRGVQRHLAAGGDALA